MTAATARDLYLCYGDAMDEYKPDRVSLGPDLLSRVLEAMAPVTVVLVPAVVVVFVGINLLR